MASGGETDVFCVLDIGFMEDTQHTTSADKGRIVVACVDCSVAFVVASEQLPSDQPLSSEIVNEDTIKPSLTDTSMLPDCMILRRITIMDSFPLTLNRKINQKTLPIPDTTNTMIGHNEYEAPCGCQTGPVG